MKVGRTLALLVVPVAGQVACVYGPASSNDTAPLLNLGGWGGVANTLTQECCDVAGVLFGQYLKGAYNAQNMTALLAQESSACLAKSSLGGCKTDGTHPNLEPSAAANDEMVLSACVAGCAASIYSALNGTTSNSAGSHQAAFKAAVDADDNGALDTCEALVATHPGLMVNNLGGSINCRVETKTGQYIDFGTQTRMCCQMGIATASWSAVTTSALRTYFGNNCPLEDIGLGLCYSRQNSHTYVNAYGVSVTIPANATTYISANSGLNVSMASYTDGEDWFFGRVPYTNYYMGQLSSCADASQCYSQLVEGATANNDAVNNTTPLNPTFSNTAIAAFHSALCTSDLLPAMSCNALSGNARMGSLQPKCCDAATHMVTDALMSSNNAGNLTALGMARCPVNVAQCETTGSGSGRWPTESTRHSSKLEMCNSGCGAQALAGLSARRGASKAAVVAQWDSNSDGVLDFCVTTTTTAAPTTTAASNAGTTTAASGNSGNSSSTETTTAASSNSNDTSSDATTTAASSSDTETTTAASSSNNTDTSEAVTIEASVSMSMDIGASETSATLMANTNLKSALSKGIAATLGVADNKVTITGIEIISRRLLKGRSLASKSVAVDFEVAATANTVANLKTSIETVDTTSLKDNITTKITSENVSGVTVQSVAAPVATTASSNSYCTPFTQGGTATTAGTFSFKQYAGTTSCHQYGYKCSAGLSTDSLLVPNPVTGAVGACVAMAYNGTNQMLKVKSFTATRVTYEIYAGTACSGTPVARENGNTARVDTVPCDTQDNVNEWVVTAPPAASSNAFTKSIFGTVGVALFSMFF